MYNVFGGAGKGPDIYGTEPWWFYLANLALNFNILLPLALLSAPLLVHEHISALIFQVANDLLGLVPFYSY